MQGVGRRVTLPLRQIQLAALEGDRITRIRQRYLGGGDAGELSEELRAALADLIGERAVVVREIEERAGGRELLPLKGMAWAGPSRSGR